MSFHPRGSKVVGFRLTVVNFSLKDLMSETHLLLSMLTFSIS